MKTVIDYETCSQAAQALADAIGGTYHGTYSGRLMYGTICPAVSLHSKMALAEAVGSYGLGGGSYDDMGKGAIVYWPQYTKTPQPLKDALL